MDDEHDGWAVMWLVMTKGYSWGVVLHVHAVGMDGLLVLGLQGVEDWVCDQGAGEHVGCFEASCDQGLQMGVVLHVHALGSDEQQVLGQQGGGHCECGQGVCDHDRVDSVDGVVGHDDHGL